jgi:hypothetical protein
MGITVPTSLCLPVPFPDFLVWKSSALNGRPSFPRPTTPLLLEPLLSLLLLLSLQPAAI